MDKARVFASLARTTAQLMAVEIGRARLTRTEPRLVLE